MTEYRRTWHPGATWFFTVNLAERRGNRLLVERIDVLRTAFRNARSRHPLHIEAIVILPDHLHGSGGYGGEATLPRSGLLEPRDGADRSTASRCSNGGWPLIVSVRSLGRCARSH